MCVANKLLITRIGHGQSGWSPIGCECFRTNLNIPCPLPTSLVFRYNFVGYSHIYYSI